MSDLFIVIRYLFLFLQRFSGLEDCWDKWYLYLQICFLKLKATPPMCAQVKLLACLHMVVLQVAAIQIDVDTNEPISYQPTARPLRPLGPGLGPRASPSPTYSSSDASKSYSHTFVGESHEISCQSIFYMYLIGFCCVSKSKTLLKIKM